MWPPQPHNVTLVVGCDGCGSAALADALNEFRGAVLPRALDAATPGGQSAAVLRDAGPGYFSAEDKYTRGISWYQRHYVLPRARQAVIVDGSRALLAYPFAAARVHASLARPSSHRIIVVLRDPTELAWVLWRELSALPYSGSSSLGLLLRPYLHPRNFTAKVAGEISSLSRCLADTRPSGRKGSGGGGGEGGGAQSVAGRAEAEVLFSPAVSVEVWQRCMLVGCGWPSCVVGAGLYAPQLRAWRQMYSPSQLSVLMLSDLTTRTAETIAQVVRFVGLPVAPATAEEARATENGVVQRAARLVSSRAAAATAAGTSVPLKATTLLRRFYGRFAQAVRRELELMRQPTQHWRAQEAWLWEDTNGAEANRGVARDDVGARRHSNGGSRRRRTGTSERAKFSEVREAGRGGGQQQQVTAATLAGLPRVFLLGGEKCGSTSLAFALSRHPEIRMARHALPGEPAYFRKEVHFFDDDLRYVRGLSFYAAHFPRCSRGESTDDEVLARKPSARYWMEPPTHTSEVLLEDTASNEVVGWDAELNIPGDVARTVMVIPAAEGAVGGNESHGGITDSSTYHQHRSYWLVDSASSQLLYNRDWVLRATPLDGEQLSPARRLVFVPVPVTPADHTLNPPVSRKPAANAGGDGDDGVNAADHARAREARGHNRAPSFWLVDPSTGRLLYWRDDVIRVRPWHDRDPSAAWRLRRLSDDECPHWASVSVRANASDMQWALRVAKVARGECTAGCERGPLVRSIAALLHGESRLKAASRTAVCRATCVLDSRTAAQADTSAQQPARPTAVLPAPVAGCLCGSASRQLGRQHRTDTDAAAGSRSARRAHGGGTDSLLSSSTAHMWGSYSDARRATGEHSVRDQVWPDCGCRGGAGARTLLSMDATPMLHRLAAAWRMAALLPQPARLRFIVILREPAERAASHLGMLRKLASRGEGWARLYVERDGQNASVDARLLGEAAAFASCVRNRTPSRVASAAVAAVERLPPKAWHECVAVACGFHACVVGQSIYEPQLRLWLNTFSAPQVLVLTLDEFAAAPSAALARVAGFLGLGPFPRLVLNWRWTWNVGAGSRRRRNKAVSEVTLSRLRTFFAPYTNALGVLLRKRGQARAAITVDRWPRS